MRTDKSSSSRASITSAFLATAFATVSIVSATPAFALSELQKTAPQSSDSTTGTQAAPGADSNSGTTQSPSALPDPDPLVNKTPGTTTSNDKTPGTEDASKAVEVIYDINKAPEPVRKLREMIVEAAASGDLTRLRPLLGTGADQTQVMVGEPGEDPVSTLKDLSGDEDGIEIMAIILDIISTGFVHVGQGTPDEMYVWPYFAEKDLKALTPPEKVELLRIITAGDLSDMQEFGGYNFYRIGITPAGKWKFFTAGD